MPDALGVGPVPQGASTVDLTAARLQVGMGRRLDAGALGSQLGQGHAGGLRHQVGLRGGIGAGGVCDGRGLLG